MKCSNVIVPGMQETSKIKNPGLAVKLEKDMSNAIDEGTVIIDNGGDELRLMYISKEQKDGRDMIGEVTLDRERWEDGTIEYTVQSSGIGNPKYLRKGLGVKMYVKALEALLQRTNADYFSSGGMTSESAIRVWRSLFKNIDKHLADYPEIRESISLMPINEMRMIRHPGGGKEEPSYERDVGSEPAYSIELYPERYRQLTGKDLKNTIKKADAERSQFHYKDTSAEQLQDRYQKMRGTRLDIRQDENPTKDNVRQFITYIKKARGIKDNNTVDYLLTKAVVEKDDENFTFASPKTGSHMYRQTLRQNLSLQGVYESDFTIKTHRVAPDMMKISTSYIEPIYRGTGIVIDMYLAAIEDAKSRGVDLYSDWRVKPRAMLVYGKLAKLAEEKDLGFKVIINPTTNRKDLKGGRYSSLAENRSNYWGGFYETDDGLPVIRIHIKNKPKQTPYNPDENAEYNNP